jgi:hypothetical protein
MKRLALLVLCACSSGGGTSPNAYLGTWTVGGNGTLTQTTSFSGAQTMPFSGSAPASQYNIAFSKGTSSDLVSIDKYGCKLTWSVSGGGANLDVPQSCTASGSLIVQVNSGNLTLTPQDETHLSAGGHVAGLVGNDATAADASGTLTKMP